MFQGDQEFKVLKVLQEEVSKDLLEYKDIQDIQDSKDSGD